MSEPVDSDIEAPPAADRDSGVPTDVQPSEAPPETSPDPSPDPTPSAIIHQQAAFAQWTAADIRAQLEFTLSRRVRSTIYRGAMDARRRDERYAVRHLFYALLQDRDGTRALAAAGAAPDRLRAWMVEHRALGYPDSWTDGHFQEQLHAVLFNFYQHALSAQCHSVDAAHLLVSLMQCADRDNQVITRLRGAGVTELKLKDYAAHGPRQRSPAARLWHRIFGPRAPSVVGLGVDPATDIRSGPGTTVEPIGGNPLSPLGARMELQPIPDTEVHVVVHNDPYTTKVFVAHMLGDHFGMNPQRAAEITEHTHHVGWAYLGPLTLEVATMRIRDVHEQARAQGFPLRLSMHRKRPR